MIDFQDDVPLNVLFATPHRSSRKRKPVKYIEDSDKEGYIFSEEDEEVEAANVDADEDESVAEIIKKIEKKKEEPEQFANNNSHTSTDKRVSEKVTATENKHNIQVLVMPKKRGRGRPRKYPLQKATIKSTAKQKQEQEQEQKQKQKHAVKKIIPRRHNLRKPDTRRQEDQNAENEVGKTKTPKKDIMLRVPKKIIHQKSGYSEEDNNVQIDTVKKKSTRDKAGTKRKRTKAVIRNESSNKSIPPSVSPPQTSISTSRELPSIQILYRHPLGLLGILREDKFCALNLSYGSDSAIVLEVLKFLCCGKLPYLVQKETPFTRPFADIMKVSKEGGPPPLSRFYGVVKFDNITNEFATECPLFTMKGVKETQHFNTIPNSLFARGQQVLLRACLDEFVAGQLYTFVVRLLYGKAAVDEIHKQCRCPKHHIKDILVSFGIDSKKVQSALVSEPEQSYKEDAPNE